MHDYSNKNLYSPQMDLQHNVRAEFFSTNGTLVFLVNLVDSPVRLKVVNIEETCATDFALVLSYITVFVFGRV